MLELTASEPVNVRITGNMNPRFEEVLTPEALRFVALITGRFSERLNFLLERRVKVAEKIRNGVLPDFLPETQQVREGSWKVGSIPADLRLRRVEITGPVDRKMMINALNSGADVFMADFEDSHSPTWSGTIQGQVNLRDAVEKTLEYTSPEGKTYRLKDKLATLCVRPRGLHLVEKHVEFNSQPVPAAFIDFGLYLYHNAERLLSHGTGPYFYLPKLENHLEARLWNDVFDETENALGLSAGTTKCSVLVENVLAAFEMDEILFELRDHITALNLGRWDYIFSFIKKLGQSPEFVMPERSLLTMSTHFLHSCSQLLVRTCHKREAYAIGGMAAQVPSRNDLEAQARALEKVVLDKESEAKQGYDGAWVAHPDLVPIVMKIFADSGTRNGRVEGNGISKVTSRDLLFVPPGLITEEGVRSNIAVSLRYLESWLRGVGCVAINNLMEDTATVEISRTQIWQWIRFESRLSDGRRLTSQLFREILKQELAKICAQLGKQYASCKFPMAAEILDRLVTAEPMIEFLPLAAYELLDTA